MPRLNLRVGLFIVPVEFCCNTPPPPPPPIPHLIARALDRFFARSLASILYVFSQNHFIGDMGLNFQALWPYFW
jgi:hypothetical protein